MLWYKAWLDTRWRFLIGLALLVLLALFTGYNWVAVQRLMPLADAVDDSRPLGRAIREAAEVQRTFRGFIWWTWVCQNLTQFFTLFAALLGSGGLLAHRAGGTVFTLTLPVSRYQVLGTRAGTGLAELAVLALVPSMVLPVAALLVGQRYAVTDALVHGSCVFAAGSVFFSLALFLSTMFGDVWRPLLLTCVAAVGLSILDRLGGLGSLGVIHAMQAESYFLGQGLPWAGLFTSMTVSGALVYGAAVNYARQDF